MVSALPAANRVLRSDGNDLAARDPATPRPGAQSEQCKQPNWRRPGAGTRRALSEAFPCKADHSHIGQDGAIVYANKRAEIWGAMRAWLAGGMIPDDRELLAHLTGVEYGYALREGREAIILEKKEDMKKRGLASPDLADALALHLPIPWRQLTIAGSSAASRAINIITTPSIRLGPGGCDRA